MSDSESAHDEGDVGGGAEVLPVKRGRGRPKKGAPKIKKVKKAKVHNQSGKTLGRPRKYPIGTVKEAYIPTGRPLGRPPKSPGSGPKSTGRGPKSPGRGRPRKHPVIESTPNADTDEDDDEPVISDTEEVAKSPKKRGRPKKIVSGGGDAEGGNIDSDVEKIKASMGDGRRRISKAKRAKRASSGPGKRGRPRKDAIVTPKRGRPKGSKNTPKKVVPAASSGEDSDSDDEEAVDDDGAMLT